MKKQIKSPARQQLGNSKIEINDTSTQAQKQRLLLSLRERSITTIEARKDLNILSPAARIFELRHDLGLNIQTVWTNECTPEGYRHRVAKYVLQPGRYEERRGKRHE